MCHINRTIHRGAITNFSQKITLNRKMNKILHPKQEGNNCFTKNGENKELKNMHFP